MRSDDASGGVFGRISATRSKDTIMIAAAVFALLVAVVAFLILAPRIPHVAGKSVGEATATIETAGFEVGEIVAISDYDQGAYPVGVVVRARGGWLGFARAGSTIDIEIAAGPVVAVVNGQEILAIEMERQIDRLKAQNPNTFTGETGAQREIEFRKLLLSGVIDTVLVQQAAEEAGVSVDDAEIESQIELMRAGFDTEEAFLESIGGAGLDLQALREQIADQLLTQKLIGTLDVNMDVTDKDVETFYKNNAQLFPDRKLEDVREQVREIIVQQRRADAYQAYVAELRGKAVIEIRDETLTGPSNPQ